MAGARRARLLAAMAIALLGGCAGDGEPAADGTSGSTMPTVTTSSSPDEPTQSLTGTLVHDDSGAWYLELERADRDTYGASRLNVMIVESFTVSCRGSDQEVEIGALPARTRATVEFTYVLDSDPVALPPTAITADC